MNTFIKGALVAVAFILPLSSRGCDFWEELRDHYPEYSLIINTFILIEEETRDVDPCIVDLASFIKFAKCAYSPHSKEWHTILKDFDSIFMDDIKKDKKNYMLFLIQDSRGCMARIKKLLERMEKHRKHFNFTLSTKN